MTSRAALAKRIAKLERLARPKPKIDPALAQRCREELARRVNNAYSFSQEHGDELMARIRAGVERMRAAESNYYD